MNSLCIYRNIWHHIKNYNIPCTFLLNKSVSAFFAHHEQTDQKSGITTAEQYMRLRLNKLLSNSSNGAVLCGPYFSSETKPLSLSSRKYSKWIVQNHEQGKLLQVWRQYVWLEFDLKNTKSRKTKSALLYCTTIGHVQWENSCSVYHGHQNMWGEAEGSYSSLLAQPSTQTPSLGKTIYRPT